MSSASPDDAVSRTTPTTWLRSVLRGRASRSGLFLSALVIGGGAELEAVGFRYLILGATWVVTGSSEFGQLGRWAAHICPGWSRGSSPRFRCSAAWSTGR